MRLLLPAPQQIELSGEMTKTLHAPILLNVDAGWGKEVNRYLWMLDEVLAARKAGPVKTANDSSQAGIRILKKTDGGLPYNGYELEVGKECVVISAADAGGVFNGLATLSQMIELCDDGAITLPTGRIRDWPDVQTRAVHIDMTCQQYTVAYVQQLMRTLARYKVNAILMEYSAMFPFREHKVICRPDAFNEEDIKSINQTAAECNQELIPFLQCCGHLEYVLTCKEYAHFSSGHGAHSYCLANDDAVMPFVQSLIDEIIAQHPGLRRLQIGGDEVSAGKCKRCQEAGDFMDLYFKHYSRVAEYCRKLGITPLMWADVVLKNDQQKRAKKALPHNIVFVDWCYSGKFNRTGIFQDMGFQAFTASAARNRGDQFDLPRLQLHMYNIRDGFIKASELKLAGSIITSWSYRGAPHEVCLPEYAGAVYGWNTHMPDTPELTAIFFQERYGLPEADAQVLSKTALAEGNIKVPTTRGIVGFNGSISSASQAGQLLDYMTNTAATISLQNSLQILTNGDSLWQAVLRTAVRNQRELQSWDLTRRHLIHRLKLALTLTHPKKIEGNDATNKTMEAGPLELQFDLLNRERDVLREEWQQLYHNVFTPSHMKNELDYRFDAETGIVEKVMSAKKLFLSASSSSSNANSTEKSDLPPMVGHWPLSGTTEDVTGKHIGGSSRGISFTNGPDGTISNAAALFDGRQSIIEAPDAESLHFGQGDFSVTVYACFSETERRAYMFKSNVVVPKITK